MEKEVEDSLISKILMLPKLKTTYQTLATLRKDFNLTVTDEEGERIGGAMQDITDSLLKASITGTLKFILEQYENEFRYMLWEMNSISTNRILSYYTPKILQDMKIAYTMLSTMPKSEYILPGIIEFTKDEYIKDRENILLRFKDRIDNPDSFIPSPFNPGMKAEYMRR